MADLSAGEEVKTNLASLHQLHADLEPAARFRAVAHDVFHFHLASQANMYAGSGRQVISFLPSIYRGA
jgi:hypothetical protein